MVPSCSVFGSMTILINSLEKTQQSIDFVMSEAYTRAFSFVEREVKKYMLQNPDVVKYHHSVGWGPAFEFADGKMIQWASEMPDLEGEALLKFCDNFFDVFGAANEEVTLSS